MFDIQENVESFISEHPKIQVFIFLVERIEDA